METGAGQVQGERQVERKSNTGEGKTLTVPEVQAEAGRDRRQIQTRGSPT